MSSDSTTVSVRILDKEYQVTCPTDEVEELTASARYVDEQMRTIRDSGKVLGLDRMAVMTALNVTHDYLRLEHDNASSSKSIERRVSLLSERVANVLADQKQLNL